MVQDIYVTENDIIELSKNQRINKDNFDENEPIKEFRGILEYNQTSTEVYINEISDVYRFGDKNIPIKKEDVLKVSYLSSIDHTNERFSSRIISEAIINNEKSGLLDLLKLFDENIDTIYTFDNFIEVLNVGFCSKYEVDENDFVTAMSIISNHYAQ